MSNFLSKKIKLLFVHHGKGLGGAPLSLLYLIQGLDKSKYYPCVLFLHQSEIIDLYQKNGIETFGPINIMDFPHTKIWWFRWYHLPYFFKAIKDTIKTLFIAPKILKKINPDILHLNTSSLIAWGLVAHHMHIPLAWHIREPLAEGYVGLRKKLITWCVKKCARAIIPISHSDATPWKKLLKTKVIHNTVTIERFDQNINPESFCEKYKLDLRAPKILFLGGISREKGTHIILEIFAQLRKAIPDAQLLIAGDTSMLHAQPLWPKNFLPGARFVKHIAHHVQNLCPNIKLLGSIHDVPEAMAASTIIVFPATVGHFARPIIEAGFMKKPVIASNLAPLNELVIHEKTGFLLPYHDTQSWVKALTQLLQDQKLCKQMGEEAYRFCTTNFNLENHAKNIQAVYDTILSREKSNEPRAPEN